MTASPIGPDYLLAGRYRLRSKIGGGGMGSVWRAWDELLKRDVAVKQVFDAGTLTESARSDALREGRIAAQLRDPHVIAMHDLTLEAGEPWLVMEFAPARTLAQVLAMVDTLPPLQAAQIGAQIGSGLAAAHEAGIIHRDIKPGNILITDRGPAAGTVKITDFGIARITGETDDGDDAVITGTPAYFAPEVARGAKPTEASDVFALGATLYTAIEGTPPFGLDEDPVALLHRVAGGQIELPSRAGDVTEALLHMLEPDPARRPSMRQAADALALHVATATRSSVAHVLASPLTSPDGTLPIWIRRQPGTRLPNAITQTQAGLPAAQLMVPLPQVPSPRMPLKDRAPLVAARDTVARISESARTNDLTRLLIYALITTTVLALIVAVVSILAK